MSYAPGIAEFVERANAVLPPDYHTRPLAEQRRCFHWTNLRPLAAKANMVKRDRIEDAQQSLLLDK